VQASAIEMFAAFAVDIRWRFDQQNVWTEWMKVFIVTEVFSTGFQLFSN
jgi:hypothetical protein